MTAIHSLVRARALLGALLLSSACDARGDDDTQRIAVEPGGPTALELAVEVAATLVDEPTRTPVTATDQLAAAVDPLEGCSYLWSVPRDVSYDGCDHHLFICTAGDGDEHEIAIATICE